MWLVVREGHWKQSSQEYSAAMPFSGGGHFGKIWPHPSVLRSPRQNNNPGGITALPLTTQLPRISPRDKAPSTIGIRIGSTYQWAGISPTHQEAYSKPPYLTSATRGADTRSKRGYDSIIHKKVTTPKTYINEKTEDYNSDEGERKNPRETTKQ